MDKVIRFQHARVGFCDAACKAPLKREKTSMGSITLLKPAFFFIDNCCQYAALATQQQKRNRQLLFPAPEEHLPLSRKKMVKFWKRSSLSVRGGENMDIKW